MLSSKGVLIRLGMAAAIALLPSPRVVAAEITVVGTEHLAQLDPAPDGVQLGVVVDALVGWQPTLVCIEAIPGERVQDFIGDPERYGQLLAAFAPVAVRLGPEQQVRRQLAAPASRAAALRLVRSDLPLSQDDALLLVSLHLAGYEPWSAALVWSGMEKAERDSAATLLGRRAVEALDALLASPGEIAHLAIPTARRLGHRQLCHADTFHDELAVADLGAALAPMMESSTVAEGIAAFNAESSAQWKHRAPGGLLGLLEWLQTADFARQDRTTQWDIFATGPGPHDAGVRRLALWHARNAEISAHLYRALAQPEGGRVLMLVGAAHRPFLEDSIAAQPWIRLSPAKDWLVSP